MIEIFNKILKTGHEIIVGHDVIDKELGLLIQHTPISPRRLPPKLKLLKPLKPMRLSLPKLPEFKLSKK